MSFDVGLRDQYLDPDWWGRNGLGELELWPDFSLARRWELA